MFKQFADQNESQNALECIQSDADTCLRPNHTHHFHLKESDADADSLDLLLSEVCDALDEVEPTIASEQDTRLSGRLSEIREKVEELSSRSGSERRTRLSDSKDIDFGTPSIFLAESGTMNSAPSASSLPRGLPRGASRRMEPDPDIRARIEGYEVKSEIGRGGMGSVWRARERSTGRHVAIKFLDANRLSSETAKARFEREVRLAARLEHPYIARVYGTGLTDECYFYVMELIDGVPLDQHVRRYHLSLEETLVLLHRVCTAVEHAHTEGIIHRDLKPSNILITPNGEPRIVDFGLAKACSETVDDTSDPTLSVEGHVAGSPGYMSPEQAAGRVNEIDQRTDVYALGAILFKLLTGQHPHDQNGPLYEVVRRIIDEPIRNPRKLNPRIDRELEALLLTALAHDQDDRYATPAMMAQDLLRYINGEKLMVQAPSFSRWRRTTRKHWKQFLVAGLLLSFHAVLGVSVGQMIMQDARQEAEEIAQRDRLEQRLDSLYQALRRYENARGSRSPLNIAPAFTGHTPMVEWPSAANPTNDVAPEGGPQNAAKPLDG